MRARSNVLVHAPITTVATALPEKLVSARASDMNLSMPTISPMPSSNSGRWLCRPAASVANPAPVTPAAPLEAMIMNARVKAGWVDEADLHPAQEEEEAEPQHAAE